jgi:hypothetical protein
LHVVLALVMVVRTWISGDDVSTCTCIKHASMSTMISLQMIRVRVGVMPISRVNEKIDIIRSILASGWQ